MWTHSKDGATWQFRIRNTRVVAGQEEGRRGGDGKFEWKLSEVKTRAVSRGQNELIGEFKMAANDVISIRGWLWSTCSFHSWKSNLRPLVSGQIRRLGDGSGLIMNDTGSISIITPTLSIRLFISTSHLGQNIITTWACFFKSLLGWHIPLYYVLLHVPCT